MDHSKLSILVCLFNKNVLESDTIQSLLNSSEIISSFQLYIWDNSLVPLSQNQLMGLRDSFSKLQYTHTPENRPLSHIYNKIASDLSNDSYLMLCDDDSLIPNIFFKELTKQIEANKMINLFLPRIYDNNVLISPAKDYIIKSKFLTEFSSGICSTKYLTAINSCMVVSDRVFKNGFRYDERLNFYGTDTYFMVNYVKNHNEAFILDVEIQHKLSFHSSDNLNNKLRIFVETRNARNIIYSGNMVNLFLVKINTIMVAIKFCIKYGTLTFLYAIR